MRWYLSTRARLGLALGVLSLICIVLFFVGAVSNQSMEYKYLMWNLCLAWIPLGIALWLERMLRTKLWGSWPALILSLFWLGFLPNSFYVLTDFVHLQELPRVDVVFDVIMIGAFVLNSFILGYLSLFVVHCELRKRLSVRISGMLVGAVLLLTSFAIYIGRDLRWNTWDVFFNPTSLLFDISDRMLHIGTHPEVVSTTLSFFALLTSVYAVIWYAVRALRQQKMTP